VVELVTYGLLFCSRYVSVLLLLGLCLDFDDKLAVHFVQIGITRNLIETITIVRKWLPR